MAGTVIIKAPDLIARGKRLVALLMDMTPNDVDFADGVFTVPGSNTTLTLF